MKTFEEHQEARRRRSISRHRRAGGATLPPNSRSALVWAWDSAVGNEAQSHRSIIGPTATLGSSSSADTNDPSRNTTAPFGYTFGVDDYLNFGDNFDSVLTGAFTFQVAINLTAGDIAAALRAIMDKAIGIEVRCGLGKPQCYAYYGGGVTNRDGLDANAALPAGRHVITVTRDPALARASRLALFVAGSSVASTPSGNGVDGSVSDVANPIRIGLSITNVAVPVDQIASAYLWTGVLSAGDILANAQYTKVTRGWS